MQLESMYQEIILDHYRNPHHKGLPEPYDAEVHHVNPLCGDEVTLRVMLKTMPSDSDGDADSEAVVEDVSYEGLGCSISQASGLGDVEPRHRQTGFRGDGGPPGIPAS